MEISIIWLGKMVLAHLVSDFWWQPTRWVQDKQANKIRSRYLYLHILVTGITALLLVGTDYWKAVFVITVLHGLIDIIKAYTRPTFVNFVTDQAAHIAVIVLTWTFVFDQRKFDIATFEAFYQHSRFWIFVAVFFFLTIPSSLIIAQATKHWNVPPGLQNAGKYIGMIERVLICILVYLGQYEAIGLLITGKSILRYNANNEEAKTEYLLIGTLLSIFIAFIAGIALKFGGY